MRVSSIDKWDLKFTKLIRHEIPNGFISNIVVGERRRGKSIYVLKCFAQLFYMLEGLAEEECYKKALTCFIFGPDELTTRIQYNTQKGITEPCICIDDATVHFNPMVFFMNPYQYGLLGGIFDTIGTATNCIALTCPKKKRLMGGLKNYDDYTTQIIRAREGGYERTARGIFWYTWPDDSKRWRKSFVDSYSCYAPDYIYIPYLKKRKEYLKITNEKFMFLQKKLDETNSRRFSGVDLMKKNLDTVINDLTDEMVDVKENGDGTV